MARNSVRRRDGERGFALLIVFLMAAAVALMLYQQVPRVAFESERDKEQLLIDRGEQYKRAIQLYFVTYKKYPARLEDLENTNNIRFLRRRYVDPFTGKDEWRLIHTNGIYITDSLVQKPPGQAQPGALNAQNAAADPNAPQQTGPADVNQAVLRRPSDRSPGVDEPPGGDLGGDPNNANNASVPQNPVFPPITLTPAAQGGLPQGMPGQSQPLPGQPFNGQGPLPGMPIFPTSGANPANQPFFTGQAPNTSFRIDANGRLVPVANASAPGGVVSNQTLNNQPGNQNAPGAIFGGGTGGRGINPTGGNQAVDLINQLLTQPRQPPPGIGAVQAQQGQNPGIVGVASTHTAASIKRYADRGHYNEWEFIFQVQNPGQQVPGQQGQRTPGLGGTQGFPTQGSGTQAPPVPPGAPPGGMGFGNFGLPTPTVPPVPPR